MLRAIHADWVMQDFMRLLRWFVADIVRSPAKGATQDAGLPQLDLPIETRGLFVAFVYTCVIGWIDLETPPGLRLDLLYLFACVRVGWVAGARATLFFALVSASFLYVDGIYAGEALPRWLLLSNSFMSLAGLAASGWLASQLARFARNLEQAVEQRTRRLQTEMEEHKATAGNLHQAHELLKQVTENITEVFWVTDPAKSRFNYVSRGFERIWGQTRQAIYTSPAVWLEGICAEHRERVTQAMVTRQSRGDYDEEYQVRRPDGSVCWVHDRAFPVQNENSEVYRIVGVAKDITYRKRAEELMLAQRDIAAALSVTSGLSAALDQLLEITSRLEGIDCAGVYLLDQHTGALELEAHVGLSPAILGQVAEFASDAPETHQVMKGAVLYSAGSSGYSPAEWWAQERLSAMLMIPLQHEARVIGAWCLGSRSHKEISSETRLGLETVAAHTAGAIARIRLEQQILEISDREQARIGRDIHDGLSQQLIGVAFNANSLESSLRTESHPQAAVGRKILTLLDEAITESRRVCRGLYPVRLETEGLVPALEDLARTTTERYGICCECEAVNRIVADGVRSLPFQCNTTTATHLYRVAQEAVNNAIKHSGGRHVLIRLTESSGELRLTVKDDGSGMKIKPKREGSMGLHIMDYRARSIGGSLSVSDDENGTLVCCTLPKRGKALTAQNQNTCGTGL